MKARNYSFLGGPTVGVALPLLPQKTQRGLQPKQLTFHRPQRSIYSGLMVESQIVIKPIKPSELVRIRHAS